MKTKASLIAITCTALVALHLDRANAQSAGVAVTATAGRPALSTGLDEIVKLTKAGIDDGVILVYVRGSSVAYTPTADDLIQLREAGVSTTVTAAVMQHGDDVRKSVAASYQAPAQPQQQPVTQPIQQQPVVVAGPTYTQPASSVTVIGYPSSYGYSYPVGYSYAYPGYYGGYYSGGYYAGGCYPRYGAYYRSSGLSVGVSFGGYGGSHGGYYGGGYRGGYCGVRGGGGGYRCR